MFKMLWLTVDWLKKNKIDFRHWLSMNVQPNGDEPLFASNPPLSKAQLREGKAKPEPFANWVLV